MGCFLGAIASIVLFLYIFGGSMGMGSLGFFLMLLGGYRLALSVRSWLPRRMLGGALLFASSTLILVLHGLLLPMSLFSCIFFFGVIPELCKMTEGPAWLLTLTMTLLVWVPALPLALKEIDGRPSYRSPSGVTPAGGWFQQVRPSVYRLPLLSSQRATGSSPRFVVNEVRHTCGLLALHGIFVATPFAASRLCSLLLGTASSAELITDPAFVVGIPVVVGALGLLLLRSALEEGSFKRSKKLGGGLLSLASVLVLGGIVVGLIPVSWDLMNRGSHKESTTLPDFCGEWFFNGSNSHRGPLWGALSSWPTTLTWLLAGHAFLVFVTTIAMVFRGASARDPALDP